jgi:iron complex outermembrane recepter protein
MNLIGELVVDSSSRAQLRRKIGLRVATTALGSLTCLLCPAVHAQTGRADVLEEIVVTAQFRKENLQETPLAITAVTGEQLEQQGLTNVEDLGLVVPNANIRQQSNGFGPNPSIGLRGVNTGDFIYTSEPGVAVYVDDVYHGTLTGSAMDLLDLERVEVLRGPQGTLFGKNSLGGAIRLISKEAKGDDSGFVEAAAGSSNRLNIKGSYDLAIVPDRLFMRVSGTSKQIDGYQDRLDFTCQMIANGTPQLAGNLPQLVPSHIARAGDCKIGENGGSESNAARVMLRFLATDDLDVNLGADYSKTIAQPGADSLLTGQNPNDFLNTLYHALYIAPALGSIRFDDNRFVTGNPFKSYASYNDPIRGSRWPTDQVTEMWSASAKVDYDISDFVHLKTVAAYRTYDSRWASDGDLTALDTGTTLNLQEHEQSSVEMQLSGSFVDGRIDWTTGLFYYDSESHLGGHVFLGALVWAGIIPAFDQNDHFTTESKSAFAHVVFDATDRLALTAGIRQTDEEKTYRFDHTGYLTVDKPLKYGHKNFDWKVAADFKLAERLMLYGMAATGFRSEGAEPRPWTPAQLLPVTGEEILAYEIGFKGDFFNNRLRTNVAAFINDYDPRVGARAGFQCNNATDPTTGPFFPFTTTVCPPGTPRAGQQGILWFPTFSAPGTARGAELELTANPVGRLALTGSIGYYEYESDEKNPLADGYTHPSVRQQPSVSYSAGMQYDFNVFGGALIPRIDMFYQGERTNGNPRAKQVRPYNIVPDYTLYNARLSYISPQGKWHMALAVENLFDDFYWINIGAERTETGDIFYGRTGVPGRGREWSLTLRRSF